MTQNSDDIDEFRNHLLDIVRCYLRGDEVSLRSVPANQEAITKVCAEHHNEKASTSLPKSGD